MPVTAATQRILDRALGGERMTRDEALALMDLDLNSVDCYALMAAANEFTHWQSGGRGTVYSQVGINVWPCPENCNFCYLATKHKIVTTLHELCVEEIVARALDFERAGADEVYLMTTANYPVERFLEIGREVRRALQPETEMIANIGDFKTKTAYDLLDAGFCGVYHVYRFREGIETDIEPERRRATFDAIRESGLDLRYCVEPIGTEHSKEEIVEQMCLAREFGAGILSVMRRIPVPGTPYAQMGRLSESQIARIVAISRLFLGDQIRQMGVHEPSLVSLRAGAHRICAEVGMNPRDLAVDTSKGRGLSVAACEEMLWEAGFTHERKPAAMTAAVA
jgi:biotin synthase